MRTDVSADDARYCFAGIPDAELAARELEQLREERWAAFVQDMKPFAWAKGTILTNLGHAYIAEASSHRSDWTPPPAGSITELILNFKDGQEWSAVLAALSRVFADVEQERERLLTQG